MVAWTERVIVLIDQFKILLDNKLAVVHSDQQYEYERIVEQVFIKYMLHDNFTHSR